MKLFAKIAAAALLSTIAFQAYAAEKITVFAAASLKDVMETAAADFKTDTGNEVVVSLGASSALAKQIEAAAPAQVFISADEKWMDYVAKLKLIKDDSRKIVARNELVIAVAKTDTVEGDAAAILGKGKFAMGDPASVPAGIYAQASLTSLGVWDSLKPSAVFAENVRAALAFVDKGELPSAIVYASDVAVAEKLRTAYTFPKGSHPDIEYPAAVLVNAPSAANDFVEFLLSEKGQAIFKAKGFLPAAQ